MSEGFNETSYAHAADAPLLAADVGGTHARIAVVGPAAGGASGFSIPRYEKYACAQFPSLAAIIEVFRGDVRAGMPDRVALAIAGHVVDDVVVNVNLPWEVSVSALRGALGVRDLAVVNDFEALAHAIGHVDNASAALLAGPARSEGAYAEDKPILVVGPGTGLGAAVRIRHAGRTVVLATEAGQATLAPDTELEFALLAHMRKRGARVQIEQVLSGTGLINLHEALRHLRGAPPIVVGAAQITAAARAGADPIAAEAVEVFCGWFGSVLGDMAMLYGAEGGIYLAGGVLPQMRDLLERSRFAERFLDKGVMRETLARTPVRLIDHAQLGVIGAASWYFSRDANARTATRVGTRNDGESSTAAR